MSRPSSLLVRLGQEYVYQPRSGDAARGAVPQTTDSACSPRRRSSSSDELKRRVIRAVGLQTLDPRQASAWANAADDAQPEPDRGLGGQDADRKA